MNINYVRWFGGEKKIVIFITVSSFGFVLWKYGVILCLKHLSMLI
jgi:hypothetical protein